MNPSSNPLVMLLDIFRSPTSCFLALYQRGGWGWQPFIFLMLSPFLFWGAYFSNVDFTWLSDQLTVQFQQIDPQQIELLEPNTLMASAIINDVFNRFATLLLLAFWSSLQLKQVNNNTVIGNGLRHRAPFCFQRYWATLQATQAYY